MNNKYYLLNKLKKSSTAYLFLFILGSHYAYMGKWGLQLLFWLTAGGFFIWWFIDIFRVPGIVDNYNKRIYFELDKLDRLEKLENS